MSTEQPRHIASIAPRPLSRLTYKIMGVNIITLAILAMSFSYISQTRENLIQNEIDNFESETRLYATILGRVLSDAPDGADVVTVMTHTLSDLNVHDDQQVLLFDASGQKIVRVGDLPERKIFNEMHDSNLNVVTRGMAYIENMLSVNFKLPHFPGAENVLNADIPKIEQSVGGLNIAAWSAQDGGLILSADTPLLWKGKKFVTLQLVRRDLSIEDAFARTRLAVMRFSVISLVLTISFSLYLSGLIGHPLRRLATAAEAFRLSRGRECEIPDLSDRDDEIGELSLSMRDMAEALKKRLSAIEQFAADVAHELKNPLTSLKSAVETLPIVKIDEDRTRLIGIIHHDIQRMDRLISDISQASRLDAELSRDVLGHVDIRDVLDPLIDAIRDPIERGCATENGMIQRRGFDRPCYVIGQASRLAQVFDNLISNAVSFSPAGQPITITIDSADQDGDGMIRVMVEDCGPGIPENRLHKIFDRFYSERPVAEDFGHHSGLGLSIARQIVESHGGRLWAENRKNAGGHVIGARFIAKLRDAT